MERENSDYFITFHTKNTARRKIRQAVKELQIPAQGICQPGGLGGGLGRLIQLIMPCCRSQKTGGAAEEIAWIEVRTGSFQTLQQWLAALRRGTGSGGDVLLLGYG